VREQSTGLSGDLTRGILQRQRGPRGTHRDPADGEVRQVADDGRGASTATPLPLAAPRCVALRCVAQDARHKGVAVIFTVTASPGPNGSTLQTIGRAVLQLPLSTLTWSISTGAGVAHLQREFTGSPT
jgi:hypothetical protein